jgi:hypothetical protein
MRKQAIALLGIAAALLLGALSPAAASAAPETPVWKLSNTSQPTYFIPGSEGKGEYLLIASNVGAKATSGEITIADTLPAGIVPMEANADSTDTATAPVNCPKPVGQAVTCTTLGPLHPSYSIWVHIPVKVETTGAPTNTAEVKGGAAPKAAIASTTTTISAATPPFEFLSGQEGFSAPLIESDGSAPSLAGSHPYEQIVNLGFPTVNPSGELLTSAGHLRDTTIELPRGMLGNPAATPVRCTEAQLTSNFQPGCPNDSQVGTITITTFVSESAPKTTPLYNMVPPPGAPAAFSFDALGVGIYPHVIASLRTEGDYGVSATTNDILARGGNPILSASVELWGDPSSTAHDDSRGLCLFERPPPCEADPQQNAFLTLPGDCPGNPTSYGARADSWEEPQNERAASYESAELGEGGATQPIKGCDELKFEPEIDVKPTTNVTDSPSGLDVDLKQPQELNKEGRYTSALKEASLTLPQGLAVNASQADGLAVCSSAQIGLLSGVGKSPVHFSKAFAGCPDASRIGTLEATSPLLAQYNEKEEVARDGEGNPLLEPLHGSVYLAKPFDNPFDSLLAIYLTVEDPKTGIVVKLAGEVEPNPVTGQLSTRFAENPELPLSEAKVHLFTGARAPLQTPLTCATHTTDATLTPWSNPSAPLAKASSFATTASPLGGNCPATEAAAPNSPSLTAGTLNPTAKAFSPLVLKLSRPDGSQRLSRLEATLAPGLSAKLAGIPQCSAAQIAAAEARSKPEEGKLEQASPSCPAASEVGTVTAGVGAGPNPFYIQGHVYLAGPYKGAPLSFVVITPAVAGPIDLGTVVIRTAVYINPETAQARAVSDPFPQILQGIPVDLRSVAVKLGRPSFTLNPTSCNPSSINAITTSTLGLTAALSDPFQVGGCQSLPYKPKIGARLFGPIHRGGHPSFRTVFEAKPGEANTARIVFALPRSEFIDQSHFRTICTRVQFAASQCPAGSIYGQIKAKSPLVDYMLEGPVYLRSSSHKLPDIVAALRGPASQPIEVDLDGRVDSVNGGIRTTFDLVPDQPVTKAIVTLQGAKKGLFQNSTNICKGTHRASVKLTGQNAKVANLSPPLKADCPKAKKKSGGGGHRK